MHNYKVTTLYEYELHIVLTIIYIVLNSDINYYLCHTYNCNIHIIIYVHTNNNNVILLTYTVHKIERI